uniref:Two component transcriptional regulator, LuxR family n=1 Tax=Candidatus Kentrum sp. MB TaxID=2138164 RepID=A0A450XKL2_9GAMM|nr:MAG: two component transcriptional regulator, LuxR family [Candidatus Kentron sp. MB]VFK29688.1 MAG: two component transcriptional regulator, LuxR family [Candidatus Kentron sp. MB]VFK74871.1 MAG: two component transcriptional regulator, LuxR family [Candidatus Kentron sp. MB]
MVRILFVSEVRLCRDGIKQFFSQSKDIEVVGLAANPREAVRKAHTLKPRIILLHLTVRGQASQVRELVQGTDGINVVVLVALEVEDEIVSYLEAGAVGYLDREAGMSDVLATIDAALKGEFLCSARLAGFLVRKLATCSIQKRGAVSSYGLTNREMSVLDLIQQGLSNKEIARTLCIEVSTVKNHVHSILEKTGAHRRSEVAALLGGYRTRITATKTHQTAHFGKNDR